MNFLLRIWLSIYFRFLRKKLPNLYGESKYYHQFNAIHHDAIMMMNYQNANQEKNGEFRWVDALVANWVDKKVKPTIIDVGANVGKYVSKFADSAVGPNISLFAFEPNLDTYKLLVDKNGQKKGVSLFNFGMGNKNKTVTLYEPLNANSHATIFADALDGREVREVSIEIKRLDEFCADHKIEHIDFLKIDVEGYEVNVLEGIKSYIDERKIDYILFEYNYHSLHSKIYLNDFFQIFKSNYKVYRILKDKLIEVHYSYYEEIPLMINFVAIRSDLADKVL